MRMLHWPDSMATYMTGENILFANDAFGQHFAVEELFKVEVKKVNTLHVRGQLRHYGRFEGYTRSWKKAIVTLTEASKTIEFFDGMM